MNDFNETTRILNAESQDQLIKARDAELAKILKLRLVLDQLRRMRAKDMDLPEQEQVDWALKVLSIRNFLRLKESNNDYLLDLEQCRSVSISYTERKTVRQHLIQRLQTAYKPIAVFGQKLRDDFPELFAATAHSSSINNSSSNTAQEHLPYMLQLRELELQRRENLLKLVELRNRKCAYMKAAAQLKMGPYLTHELELLYENSRMNQAKTMLLRGFMINELVARSDHSLKALNEAETFVNEALEQAEK